MDRTNLYGYTIPQIEGLMSSLGEKPYHGHQLFNWIYGVRQYEFDLMTDLSLSLRQTLQGQFTIRGLKAEQEQVSIDGTRKFLFRQADGHPIETVLIPDDSGRSTLCVSSQAGCALACHFCATGTLGLLSDLTVGEIVGQVAYVRDKLGDKVAGNIVFMGMGEPFHNYQNVLAAIEILVAPSGLNISPKKITISTSGISPKIRRLADSGNKCRLAISLHAATQEKRAKIMPVAETFGLDGLMEAIRYYVDKTGLGVTFEYILFDGFNDSEEDVKTLSRLVRGLPCMINILAYNPVEGLEFSRPSDERVDWFGGQLNGRVPAVTVRKSRGLDIAAACGQLAAKNITEGK